VFDEYDDVELLYPDAIVADKCVLMDHATTRSRMV
jgi:hypothetical protein